MSHDSLEPIRSSPSETAAPRGASLVRTTILPRVRMTGDAPDLAPSFRTRYDTVKSLGSGGMADVVLARDNDIQRLVAVKQLKPGEASPALVMRFVEEIQTVGTLEHPSIVPIHDVGVDENGKYFFVMKYIEGETLEEIITKLDAGDAHAHARFPAARRQQIFLQVLRAMQFAHAQGIVHRDIKPANIMVGRFGEVMVMDWGVAKRIRGDTSLPASREEVSLAATLDPDAEGELAGTAETRERLFKTRQGSLLGTPAYMSPEQARAENDKIDERSDVYSLCAVFWELMTLRHYLGARPTLIQMLAAVMTENLDPKSAMGHPFQQGFPLEVGHFVVRGLDKDPAKRWQSVDEMIRELEASMAGRCAVTCPFTGIKRVMGESASLVDRRPFLSGLAFLAMVGMLVYGSVQVVRQIVGAVVG